MIQSERYSLLRTATHGMVHHSLKATGSQNMPAFSLLLTLKLTMLFMASHQRIACRQTPALDAFRVEVFRMECILLIDAFLVDA